MDSLHSNLWYRVANLKPQLRRHAEIRRHHYRGQRWYILQDRASGGAHRFSPAAHCFIAQMDGKRTVNDIWETVIRQLGDTAPSQEQAIQLLGQLHANDLLQCEIPPDDAELFSRHKQHKQSRLKQRLSAPLSVRIPLVDPERFLARWQHLVRPLFTPAGLVIWLAVIGLAILLAGQHWTEITSDIFNRVSTPQNLMLMVLTYPLVKLLHELGHAFSTHIWGGEVHEMGIMLIALMPLPYVDASAATAFEDKRRRMLVGAAGMQVELFLAALALFVWINVEPGIVSSLCYNIMLIGSVSTLFFNGNPLLRFDGYYILADAIEIPGLGTRSSKYIGYLLQRYLFGASDLQSPARARGEAAWFLGYGIASFIYRMAIMFFIILYVAGKFFIIGTVLALWAVATQIILPLWRNISHLFKNPALQAKRGRVITTTGLLCTLLAWLLFFMPAPLQTRAEGVVWVPEKSELRIGASCFISRLAALPGAQVSKGDAILECEDPLLEAQAAISAARLRELKAGYLSVMQDDKVRAEGIKAEIATAEKELALLQEQLDEMVLHSQANGRLVIPGAQDLQGRFVHKGDVLAYVTGTAINNARVAVTQNDINLVRERTREVEVRLAGNIEQVVPAIIKREVPAATEQLPSRALGTAGGGRIAVDPLDENGLTALEKVFQFELALSEPASSGYFGQRVHVRFDHGSEPLASQWQRSLRQLFMERLGV
jgi:putative peptide zinc metalloprotease protein